MLTNTTEFLAINANLPKLHLEGHSQGKLGICESGIKLIVTIFDIFWGIPKIPNIFGGGQPD